jgi:CBS domain containing-hemolysin-like protein
MLQNIFELGNTPVKDIMVSASDIISVNIDRTAQEVLDVFSRHRFTRLPVYKDRVDNMIGMIHQKDVFVLLLKQNIKVLKEIVRPIMFVPETLKVNQLLREFRKQHMHIGIVLNEHGIVTGLITLEDVLEEIVGEIRDEHEAGISKIITLKDGSFMVEGTVSLDDIEKQIGIQFKNTESVTIGGFLTEQMQRFPQKGDKLVYHSHLFTIQKTGNRRIYQVHINRITK